MKYLVVSAYMESIEWLSQVPAGWAVLLYGKAVAQNDAVILPNIGREAHTYLHDIVVHYELYKNAESVVFCQGNPFDHDPKFVEHLSDESVRHYGILWECPSEGELQMTMYGKGLLDEYCRVFGLPAQAQYRFSTGAQYRVTGEQIRSRPLAFYEALLAITKIDPVAPYRLERLWPLIWGIAL